MILKPVMTEKSLDLAKKGKYTFSVGVGMRKNEIKRKVEEVFDVHVTKVWTLNRRGEVKRTMQGRKRKIAPSKKAIVTLKEKEKIEIFETKKK